MHSVKTETVTPEKAMKWLGEQQENHAGKNRKIRRGLVERIKRDIQDGKWMFNGQPIIFNGSRLLDGQHRLTAILEAGIGVETIVVRGVNEDAMSVMDSGAARSVSDVLRFNSFTDVNRRPSLVKRLRWLIEGQEPSLSAVQIMDYAKQYEEEVNWGLAISAGKRNLSSGWLSACFVFARPSAPAKVTQAAEAFYNAEGLVRGDPMFALYRYCMSNMGQSRLQLSRDDIWGMALMSIKYRIDGRIVDVARHFKSDSPELEKTRSQFAQKWDK